MAIFAAAGLCADRPKEPDPRISAISPCAGRPGDVFDAVIRGADLAGARAIVLEGNGLEAAVLGATSDEGKEVKVKVTLAAGAKIGRHDFRLVAPLGVTHKIALDVLAGPVLEEAAVTEPLARFPVTIGGRLTQPGETDAYWIEITAGVTLTFEAVSRAAGFDPAVARYEPSGSWFDAQRLNRIFATVYKAFGIDWTKEYDTPIGRPIKIANSLDDTTAEPIRELL